MAFIINSVGNGLSPFDSFLLLRGTKTLAVRMDRQQSSAKNVAAMLDHLGFNVHYPGLPNHPGRDVHERIANGPGAVLSFTTGDKAMSERIVGATRLWGISVSFGCVNSLISMPCVMSYVFGLQDVESACILTYLEGMHLSIPRHVPHADCQKTSSGCALVSRTPSICWTTCNTHCWKLGLSLLSRELTGIITSVLRSSARDQPSAVRLRNLFSTKMLVLRVGKTKNGSSAPPERSFCSVSTLWFMAL